MTTLQILVSLVYMAILGRLKVMHFERLSWSMAKQVHISARAAQDACCAAPLLGVLNSPLRAGFSSSFLLVAVRGVWGHSTALFDSPNVQVSTSGLQRRVHSVTQPLQA